MQIFLHGCKKGWISKKALAANHSLRNADLAYKIDLCATISVKGKVQKKTRKKKLTSASFALKHTYTLVKTNIFPFFPKRRWKILKNVQKRKN